MKRWDKVSAVRALQEWAAVHGQPRHNAWTPTPAGCPDRETLRKLFGSWQNALRAAGLPAPGPGQYARTQVDREAPCANPTCDRVYGPKGYHARCCQCADYFSRYGKDRDW